MNNKTVCSAFWNHTNIRSGNKVFPCCRFKFHISNFDGNLESILQSDAYEKLRSDSKNGLEIAGCEKCYLEESLGKKSLRQEFNDQYSTEKINLKFLEIGFDNICNLTCDGCFDEFSSAWAKKNNPSAAKDQIILDTVPIKNVPSTINKIIFLGGEPLMTNRPLKFLKKIKDLSNVSLIFYTNGTFLLKQDLINVLERAKETKFIISIDGVGKLNDRVRSGSCWQEILKFLNQISSLNFKKSIHSVIHKNNWQGFVDLANFIEDQNVEWSVGLLTYPQDLSIDTLSKDDKSKLFEILNDQRIPNSKFIKEFLINEKHNRYRKIYKLEAV